MNHATLPTICSECLAEMYNGAENGIVSAHVWCEHNSTMAIFRAEGRKITRWRLIAPVISAMEAQQICATAQVMSESLTRPDLSN